MKKSDLLVHMSEKMEITKAEAARKITDLDSIIEVVAKELEVGDNVKLGNYVVIEKKLVPARTMRNIQTGEPLEVAEKVVIKVKARSTVKNL